MDVGHMDIEAAAEAEEKRKNVHAPVAQKRLDELEKDMIEAERSGNNKACSQVGKEHKRLSTKLAKVEKQIAEYYEEQRVLHGEDSEDSDVSMEDGETSEESYTESSDDYSDDSSDYSDGDDSDEDYE